MDKQNKFRIAAVTEDILLYAQSIPYAHFLKNIFDKLVEKEKNILAQLREMKKFPFPNVRTLRLNHQREWTEDQKVNLGRAGAYFLVSVICLKIYFLYHDAHHQKVDCSIYCQSEHNCVQISLLG